MGNLTHLLLSHVRSPKAACYHKNCRTTELKYEATQRLKEKSLIWCMNIKWLLHGELKLDIETELQW